MSREEVRGSFRPWLGVDEQLIVVPPGDLDPGITSPVVAQVLTEVGLPPSFFEVVELSPARRLRSLGDSTELYVLGLWFDEYLCVHGRTAEVHLFGGETPRRLSSRIDRFVAALAGLSRTLGEFQDARMAMRDDDGVNELRPAIRRRMLEQARDADPEGFPGAVADWEMIVDALTGTERG